MLDTFYTAVAHINIYTFIVGERYGPKTMGGYKIRGPRWMKLTAQSSYMT